MMNRPNNRRKLSMSGVSGSTDQNGTRLRPITGEEEFYIRLIKKYTVGLTLVYSWVAVVRNLTEWTTTGAGGGPGLDPAFEVNNQDSPVNTVYRAYREPNSGQVLFF